MATFNYAQPEIAYNYVGDDRARKNMCGIVGDACKVYFINLERSTERRAAMEQLLSSPTLGCKRWAKVPAVEPSDVDCDGVPSSARVALAVTASHVSAMKTFLEDPEAADDEYALILEDDVDVGFAPLQDSRDSIASIVARAPEDWGALQLAAVAVAPTRELMRKHEFRSWRKPIILPGACEAYFSTAAVLVRRSAAKALVDQCAFDAAGRVSLGLTEVQRSLFTCAEFFVYDSLLTYTRWPSVFSHRNVQSTYASSAVSLADRTTDESATLDYLRRRDGREDFVRRLVHDVEERLAAFVGHVLYVCHDDGLEKACRANVDALASRLRVV